MTNLTVAIAEQLVLLATHVALENVSKTNAEIVLTHEPKFREVVERLQK
jgi:predicted MPP superfamily phosphohydrolase